MLQYDGGKTKRQNFIKDVHIFPSFCRLAGTLIRAGVNSYQPLDPAVMPLCT